MLGGMVCDMAAVWMLWPCDDRLLLGHGESCCVEATNQR